MSAQTTTSLSRDLLSAYFVSTARFAAWLIISAIVYRRLGVGAFALLALVRSSLVILNYSTLGLAPAIIRYVAAARNTDASAAAADPQALVRVCSSALALAACCGLMGLALCVVYALGFDRLFRLPPGMDMNDVFGPALLIGIGTVLRVVGDAPGASLQALGRLPLDNCLQASADLLWLALTPAYLAMQSSLHAVAAAYAVSAAASAFARWIAAGLVTGVLVPRWRAIDRLTVVALLSFGGLVVLAQAADYLYAPIAHILINRLVSAEAVAVYSPAIQIDAGLLLLSGGLAAVLLPRSAIAHAAGDLAALRRYYLRGTLAATALLVIGAAVVWLAADAIFRIWLKDPMHATQAILPLVLIHTVIGGASSVGRSVLLASGHVRPFTISVLIGGLANAALGYALARFAGLGLHGIVLGTILAVTARCAVWMPWYVLRTLGQPAAHVAENARPPLPGPPI